MTGRSSAGMCAAALLAFGVFDCGGSSPVANHTGGAGTPGGAGPGATGGTVGGAAGGAPGSAGKGPMGMGMKGKGAAGEPAVVTCTPGVQGTLVTGCGYPISGAGVLDGVVFNENEVLRAIESEGGAPNGTVRMFYNDEHALTLGVRSVVVKSASGTTKTDYPVSSLTTNPSSVTNPLTGTNELVGDGSGLDPSLRPMWPSLFLTDVTANSQSRAGDWQQGGRPINPTALFGSWKAAVRTVDKTVTPNAVTITPDADPEKNNWDLAGGDPVPAGLTNEGFGAEARWNVSLAAGHSYRLQVIVHDGDQNKAGGDSGEACVLFCSGGGGTGGAGGAGGGYTPPPVCPTGRPSCGSADGIEPASCASGTACVSGCCLPIIP